MSPTQRSLKFARDSGYTAAVVEKWNPHARCRQDLFGIVDIIAMSPEGGIIGIQACAGPSHAARRTKSLAEPRLETWLASGGRYEIWSWAKRGAKGKRKFWERRTEPITLDDYRLVPTLDPEPKQPAGEKVDVERPFA